MIVQELIERLGEFPPDLPIWHDGGGDPYCAGEIEGVRIVESEGRKLMGHENSTPGRWVELSLW